MSVYSTSFSNGSQTFGDYTITINNNKQWDACLDCKKVTYYVITITFNNGKAQELRSVTDLVYHLGVTFTKIGIDAGKILLSGSCTYVDYKGNCPYIATRNFTAIYTSSFLYYFLPYKDQQISLEKFKVFKNFRIVLIQHSGYSYFHDIPFVQIVQIAYSLPSSHLTFVDDDPQDIVIGSDSTSIRKLIVYNLETRTTREIII